MQPCLLFARYGGRRVFDMRITIRLNYGTADHMTEHTLILKNVGHIFESIPALDVAGKEWELGSGECRR
eukprot:1057725-Amphidinium_carterae.1